MISKSIGLDLGSKTCGVAVSDGLGMYAHPLTTLSFEGNLNDLIEPLHEIIRKEKIKNIALGDPKMMNNDIGERAQISRDFKILLENEFSLRVVLIDERLTSMAANRQLISQDMSRKKRKQVIDQLAAVHILQTFLDQQSFMED
ncbi:Holliday junction resolvase RuvX [Erysipelothrix urinaevulpis]|uniref:Holliday junction resolvase RuvX n=1 Tax=Erysipelothrix urinaevulpis TaxID=2683717 RepID=UPI00135AA471|nr:Holliday junction resolvase RuvX [Erysipelothrix urinaevulpis]